LFLFPLRATKKWQDKQVRQDIDNQAGEHDQPEALGGWKIGQNENCKTGPNDYIRINDSTPLFFAPGHPGRPAVLAIALRATDAAGDDPRDDNEQKIQPKESSHQTGRDQFGQTTLQIVNAAEERRCESVFPNDRTQIVYYLESKFVTTIFHHSQQKNRLRAVL